MKPQHKAATDVLDMGDGKAPFFLSCFGPVSMLSAINSAVLLP